MVDMARGVGRPIKGRASIQKRMNDIIGVLDGWAYSVDGFGWWLHYREHGTYPLDNGIWGNQPTWVSDEIRNYALWLEFEQLSIQRDMLIPR